VKYALYFNMKPWYTSKTIWIAILQAAAGVVAAFFTYDPALQTVGAVAIVKSVIDIVLRLVTSQPIQ
jgi:hypothetical protein